MRDRPPPPRTAGTTIARRRGDGEPVGTDDRAGVTVARIAEAIVRGSVRGV
jgi:hypothetical protein